MTQPPELPGGQLVLPLAHVVPQVEIRQEVAGLVGEPAVQLVGGLLASRSDARARPGWTAQPRSPPPRARTRCGRPRGSSGPSAGRPAAVRAGIPAGSNASGDPWPRSRAPSSVSSAIPSRTERASGGSRNGNEPTSPNPIAVICRITEARLVRRISGSVNSGRAAKSSSAYSRTQTPSATRPHRPARWLAEAWEIGSIGRRCTLVRWLYREIRAVPGSIT